jgi:cell division protein FtsQ
MYYSDLPIGLATAMVDGLMPVSPNSESFAPVSTSDVSRETSNELPVESTESDPAGVSALSEPSNAADSPVALMHDSEVGRRAASNQEGESDSESVFPRASFLRLVPNLERAAEPLVCVPPTSTELNTQMVLGDTQLFGLFGEVSDADFPEVSANHPARSLQAHSSAPRTAVSPQVPGELVQVGAAGTAVTGASLSAGQTARPKRNLSALSSQPFTPETRISVFAVERDSAAPSASTKQQAPARSRSYERRRPGSVGGVNTTTHRIAHPVFTSPPNVRDLRPGASGTTAVVESSAAEVRTPSPTRSPQTGSTRTALGTAPTRHAIIDLRGAERGLPVVIRRRATVDGPVATRGSAGTNYFDGHRYQRTDVAASLYDRSTQRITRTSRNQPRVSLRSRAVERTALTSRVLTGLGVGAIGLLGIGLVFSPLFSLHRIDIRRAGSAATRIRTAARLTAGEPLVALDIEAIQRRVAALPEVLAAKVERKWPRGVRITVATRTPVAALSHAGRIALVASDGTVLRDFGPGVDVVDDDGIFYRPIATDAIAPVGETVTGASKRVSDLVSALDPDLRDRVMSVTVSGDDLNASFSAAGKVGYLSVRFGDEHELNIKAHALGALLAAGSATNVAGIDLTVPDAPVLRLSGVKGL